MRKEIRGGAGRGIGQHGPGRHVQTVGVKIHAAHEHMPRQHAFRDAARLRGEFLVVKRKPGQRIADENFIPVLRSMQRRTFDAALRIIEHKRGALVGSGWSDCTTKAPS
jgi:hypothetical protein